MPRGNFLATEPEGWLVLLLPNVDRLLRWGSSGKSRENTVWRGDEASRAGLDFKALMSARSVVKTLFQVLSLNWVKPKH